MNTHQMLLVEAKSFQQLELAGAYAAFGNGGIYTKPHAIKKISIP